eukprot:716908-Pleurochrysis_carterae.AAC.1
MRGCGGATSAMRARKQGKRERSASAPQVHKPCECKNGKLCMRAMKKKGVRRRLQESYAA